MASSSTEKDFDFAIVGTGLSGLSATFAVCKENPHASVLLMEGSGRAGGRILGTDGPVESNSAASAMSAKGVDLGAAWIWPSSMPFAMKFINQFNIPMVQQKGSGGSQMRVDGGITVLIKKMLDEIDCTCANNSQEPGTNDKKQSRVHLMFNSTLIKVEEGDNKVILTVKDLNEKNSSSASSENIKTYRVGHVVIAAPPAKIVETIEFVGSEVRYITNTMKKRMQAQPIWMASAGKLALSYKKKFWNSNNILMGLRPTSSHQTGFAGGFQLYDAGVADNGEYVIVAFVTCGRGEENPYTAQMMGQIVSKQLDDSSIAKNSSTSFSEYASVHLKCWKTDKNINKVQDAAPYPQHPQPIYGLNDDAFDGRRVWFGGSEASEDWTGFIEGAVMNGTQIGKKVANLK